MSRHDTPAPKGLRIPVSKAAPKGHTGYNVESVAKTPKVFTDTHEGRYTTLSEAIAISADILSEDDCCGETRIFDAARGNLHVATVDRYTVWVDDEYLALLPEGVQEAASLL